MYIINVVKLNRDFLVIAFKCLYSSMNHVMYIIFTLVGMVDCYANVDDVDIQN